MLLKSSWRVFINAKSLRAAEKVVGRVVNALNVSVEKRKVDKYYKGGYVLTFEVIHQEEVRSEIVVDVIQRGQRLAGPTTAKGVAHAS